MKLQAAVDYLSSYGLAIVVMLAAFIAMYAIAISPNNPAVYCTPVPGFSCNFLSISKAGILTFKFSQAIGTEITINGIACASQQSGAGDVPAFGNIGVNSLQAYYSTPQYPPGNYVYSDGSYIAQLPCYAPGGVQASGPTGQAFSGYVWLNYSIPNYGEQTQKIATFSTVYS